MTDRRFLKLKGAFVNPHADGLPAGLDPKQAHVVAQWQTERPVVCCRFDPQGRYVFCGLEGSSLQRFNLGDGKPLAYAGAHESWVFSIAFSPDGGSVWSGGGDGRIVVWETAAATPKPMRTIEAHQGWVRALGVSRDGAILASGGNDRLVKLWDAKTGAALRQMSGHSGHIYSMEFHPNGKTLLTGDLMGAVNEWDLASGKLLGTFDAKELHSYNGGQQVDFGGVRGLAITPDGRFLAAGGLYKATNPLGAVHEPIALLFDGGTRKNLKTLLTDGITGGVLWRLRYLADGTLTGACGGSNGGLLLFWKADAPKDFHRLALPNILRDMDLHPDGLRIATAHHDRHVRITRLDARKA